ncbi:MAG: NADP-dependent 3-hydroxy acid dehydrogenase YdfG [Chloroflexi bacterium AL-W]|nr:NADP-dependent 3-hydroxy acid dehydrogenase YdfG [Chloroflexi bacterium AL-N1]NOK70618.1 NADP-dependent 3-hydroxy acid dehydrogenase YdfG [Chloroflexi bacterium AL-N10]NOK77610.1 NADP-dependent 3-hydroxy acid dehydrogenase YdfG [Chloroflexi bacterium AL-N5]NOK84461.1 NADP-dependent 3-hydroxy acid dehydrogenase YdfG [Chloroflexi bacterium AL-W]NOK92350.1 NADP-dependent 3-hydroxy acid dehydrogenase YdfG [Chloroflexi bacterium AL-N15]
MELRNSVIIVTGASSGIGAATARELARHDAIVVLAARRADSLDSLAREIEEQGGRALAVPTDVGRRSDIDHLVQTVLERYHRIDGLVNNAGVGGGSSMADSDDKMERIVMVNLLGPARCAQAVLPTMRERNRGVIVNIGSVAGDVGVSGIYSASKFGLRGLNDALRREVWKENIDVVLIQPGFIRTPMTKGVKMPMVEPEVVARAVVEAMQRPRRKLFVPWPYAPLAVLAKCFPWLADRIVGSGAAQKRYREREQIT